MLYFPLSLNEATLFYRFLLFIGTTVFPWTTDTVHIHRAAAFTINFLSYPIIFITFFRFRVTGCKSIIKKMQIQRMIMWLWTVAASFSSCKVHFIYSVQCTEFRFMYKRGQKNERERERCLHRNSILIEFSHLTIPLRHTMRFIDFFPGFTMWEFLFFFWAVKVFLPN